MLISGGCSRGTCDDIVIARVCHMNQGFLLGDYALHPIRGKDYKYIALWSVLNSRKPISCNDYSKIYV